MVRHWLMKSEPDAFGIDDLVRVKVEPWTGVRNYMARNYMRDQMQVGDLVLFYHSNAKPPGVAGLATVARTGVVDATQFDPASQYHDPDSRPDEPRWICVDVELVRKLPRLVPLDELRAHPGLGGMVLLQKGSRLSVQPVSPEHYALVVALADGAAPGHAPMPKGASAGTKAPPAGKKASASKKASAGKSAPASKARARRA